MQTLIDWIPGYPEDAQKHERWWVMLRGYDLPCIMASDTAEKSALITRHAPCEPPTESDEIIVPVSAVESIVKHAYRLKCMHDMYHEIMNRLPDKQGAPLRIPKGEYQVPDKSEEQQRHIALGKAVEAVFDEFEMVDLSGVDTETMKSVSFMNPSEIIAWHRAEAPND